MPVAHVSPYKRIDTMHPGRRAVVTLQDVQNGTVREPDLAAYSYDGYGRIWRLKGFTKFDDYHLRAEIEKGFDVVADDPARFAAFAPTGERYVTIGHQISRSSQPGTVDQCEARELGFDPETAYWSALGAFRQYAEDRTGKLYWRSPPRLEFSALGDRCLFWIRLLISDKPVIAQKAVA